MVERLGRKQVRDLNAVLKEQGLHYCPACGQQKPISEFYLVRSRPSSHCKPCMYHKGNQWRAANAEYSNAYKNAWYARKREVLRADPVALAEHRARAAARMRARRRLQKARCYHRQQVLWLLLLAVLEALEMEHAERMRVINELCEEFRERQRNLAFIRERHQLALERLKTDQPDRYAAYMQKLRQRRARRTQKSLMFKDFFNV